MSAEAARLEGPSVTTDPTKATIPFLVVNPRSANGSTGRGWAKWEREARRALGEVEVALTSGPFDAVRLTREALERGHRLAFAVGGDGTLNEVVNGFFLPDGSPVVDGAAVGLLPRGSGSDFRRMTGVPVDWRKACEHVARAPVRHIDVGRVEFTDFEGHRRTRAFINIGSLGVSAHVVRATEKLGKGLGGRFSYKLETIRALARYRDAAVEMRVDGGEWEQVPVTALAVANGAFFGGGMKVAPGAALDDGLFACTLWGRFKLRDFIFRQAKVYSGRHVEWERTRTFSAKRVEVRSNEEVLLELDGELVGTLPAVFDVLPGALGLKA